MLKLFHGTNNPKFPLTEQSCFTKNYDTAKDYAHIWTYEQEDDEKIGHPHILIVKGNFVGVGGADEHKAVDISEVKIVKIIKLN